MTDDKIINEVRKIRDNLAEQKRGMTTEQHIAFVNADLAQLEAEGYKVVRSYDEIHGYTVSF